jgi:hypothetical protein
MARPLRIEYVGAVYHVMARGNQGRPIFGDDQDRRRFLETLGEACGKPGWQIHIPDLMVNFTSDAIHPLYAGDAGAGPDETQTRPKIAIVENPTSGSRANTAMKQNCHFSRTDPFPFNSEGFRRDSDCHIPII